MTKKHFYGILNIVLIVLITFALLHLLVSTSVGKAIFAVLMLSLPTYLLLTVMLTPFIDNSEESQVYNGNEYTDINENTAMGIGAMEIIIGEMEDGTKS